MNVDQQDTLDWYNDLMDIIETCELINGTPFMILMSEMTQSYAQRRTGDTLDIGELFKVMVDDENLNRAIRRHLAAELPE